MCVAVLENRSFQPLLNRSTVISLTGGAFVACGDRSVPFWLSDNLVVCITQPCAASIFLYPKVTGPPFSATMFPSALPLASKLPNAYGPLFAQWKDI